MIELYHLIMINGQNMIKEHLIIYFNNDNLYLNDILMIIFILMIILLKIK